MAAAGDAVRAPGMAPLILLVDDSEDARDIYSTYLQFCGYRVTVAASGAEAIQAAHVESPDLMLLDVRMPGMTGTDAMRVLRREQRFRDIPIVALTPLTLDDERVEARRRFRRHDSETVFAG